MSALGQSRRSHRARGESGVHLTPDILRHRKPALIDGTQFESFSLKRRGLFFKTEIGVGGCRHLPGGLIILSDDDGGATGEPRLMRVPACVPRTAVVVL